MQRPKALHLLAISVSSFCFSRFISACSFGDVLSFLRLKLELTGGCLGRAT